METSAQEILAIAQEPPRFVPFRRGDGGVLGGDGILRGEGRILQREGGLLQREGGILQSEGDRPGPDINIGLSVLKREAQTITDVINQLERNGWSVTNTVGDNRLVYLENSGVNITAVRGPMGTVIIPSGPIRGRIFGENAVSVSRGEEEGIIPRGPILSRAQEMAREQSRGFNGDSPAERDAENRPGPGHTESEDVLI